MNERRRALAALAAATAMSPAALFAQGPGRAVGYLSGGSPGEGIVRALAAHGHVAGKNLRFEVRYDRDRAETGRVADELVRLAPDVLVAFGPERTRALFRASRTIPIVTGRIGDPVREGLARSLARPGLNVTGLSWQVATTARMLCLLLRHAVPRLERLVAMGYGDAGAEHEAFVGGGREAGVEIAMRRIDGPVAGERILAQLDPATDAVGISATLPADTLGRLIARATQLGLVTSSDSPEAVERGALLSFNQSYGDRDARVAVFVDKILRGASPATLPFESPDRTELVVNVATARALGRELPPEVLLRATRVIG